MDPVSKSLLTMRLAPEPAVVVARQTAIANTISFFILSSLRSCFCCLVSFCLGRVRRGGWRVWVVNAAACSAGRALLQGHGDAAGGSPGGAFLRPPFPWLCSEPIRPSLSRSAISQRHWCTGRASAVEATMKSSALARSMSGHRGTATAWPTIVHVEVYARRYGKRNTYKYVFSPAFSGALPDEGRISVVAQRCGSAVRAFEKEQARSSSSDRLSPLRTTTRSNLAFRCRFSKPTALREEFHSGHHASPFLRANSEMVFRISSNSSLSGLACSSRCVTSAEAEPSKTRLRRSCTISDCVRVREILAE